MSTRILSVFSFLKRVGFAVLFFAGHSLAQPPDVIWDRSGDGNHAQFGYLIWGMGDQNDDGYSDWAVSAVGEYGGLPENEARFLLFHGGNPPELTPYMSFVRDPSVNLRYGGGRLGDINGDGYDDWGIEATFTEAPDSQIVYIYLGGPSADSQADFVLDARPLDSGISAFGDFNGDGFDDIYHFNNVPPVRVTKMYFGAADWDTIPDWIRHSDVGYIGLPDVVGDFNGDGYDDFVSGSPATPGGGIYYGSANPDTVPRQQWNHGAIGGAAADMNGDGRDDIVVRDTHVAHVFWGGDIIANDYAATLSFPCTDGAGLGSIAGVGDFNQDGYDDIVAIDETCAMSWGYLACYLGGPWINADPVFTIEGRDPPLNLVGIFTAEALGDVDGDGVDDFALGCVNSDNDGRRGRVVIFAGDTTYHVPIGSVGPVVPADLAVSVYPNPVNGVATFHISSEFPVGQIGIIIYNLLGQTVDRFTVNASYQSRFLYDVSRLASGNYIVQAYTNTTTTARKLVVLK